MYIQYVLVSCPYSTQKFHFKNLIPPKKTIDKNEEIYLYKANVHEEIEEYIISGMNFKEQKELFKRN